MNSIFSKIRSYLPTFGLILVLLISIFFSWYENIRNAYELPYFIDEINNTRRAVHFFKTGFYSPSGKDSFSQFMTTGLASTWPAALAWLTIPGLLYSRLLLALVAWLHTLILSTAFLRKSGTSSLKAVTLGSVLWTLSLEIPSDYSFIQNPGELNGALWLATGFYLLRSKPYLAALCWGISVWACKLIYLPIVGLFALIYINNLGFSFQSITKAFKLLLLFLLPPFFWWVWLIFMMNIDQSLDWWKALYHFNFGTSLRDAPGATRIRGLFERLESSDLKWIHLTSEYQVKILILSIGTFFISGVSGVSLFLSRAKRAPWVLAVTTIVGTYSIWYFFFHPFMWLRHLQPGMYVSLGWIIFESTRFLSSAQNKKIKNLAWTLLFIFLAKETYSTIKRPIEIHGYAKQCVDLQSRDCFVE